MTNEKQQKYKEKIKIINRLYVKNNPEQRLKNAIKYHAKLGLHFDLNTYEYKWALQALSNTIMKRDDKNCQVCGALAEESHHIFYKRFYPLLSLLNNGISLCKKCHLEVHGCLTNG